MSDSNSVVDQAWAYLRSHTRGDLRFEEHLRPIKYVIAPDGRPTAPVMVAMLQALDGVLFVPQYVDDAMELQVTITQFEERGADGAVADRWRIYHGEPDDVRWAYFKIDAARFNSMVIDGDALQRPNPLAGDESQLCRHMNQDVDMLRRLCKQYGTMQVEQPVMVGIDPLGIDLRARFDVVRVPANKPMRNAQEAIAVLTAMAKTNA
jgi:hypothetical protein